MSTLAAFPVRSMAQGERNTLHIDWGGTVADDPTGCLRPADTIASCVAEVKDNPDGATNPTLGPVTVNTDVERINGRWCQIGEVTICGITIAGDQMPGEYRLRFTATTQAGAVLPRFVRIMVEE